MRSLFYMACLGAATRHNPALKAFYRRLIAKGKLAKVALVACMRKLIVILNIMIAHSAGSFSGKVSACTTQSPRGDGSAISCGPKTSLRVSQFVASIGFALVTVNLEIAIMSTPPYALLARLLARQRRGWMCRLSAL